mmetsp:Transcript_11750/g.22339  ORF Transcript_11750/g.22339 Transcript_11750/m.22339 type:complete len:408 (+) Transcript_11750:131-1354(+)
MFWRTGNRHHGKRAAGSTAASPRPTHVDRSLSERGGELITSSFKSSMEILMTKEHGETAQSIMGQYALIKPILGELLYLQSRAELECDDAGQHLRSRSAKQLQSQGPRIPQGIEPSGAGLPETSRARCACACSTAPECCPEAVHLFLTRPVLFGSFNARAQRSVVGRMCQNAAFVAQSQERRMQEAVRRAEEEGGALGAAECHTRVSRRAIELLLHHPQFRHLQARTKRGASAWQVEVASLCGQAPVIITEPKSSACMQMGRNTSSVSPEFLRCSTDVAILRRDFPFLFGQWYQQLGRRGDDWNFPSLGVSARWRLVHCQPARLGLFAPGSQARLYLEGLTQGWSPCLHYKWPKSFQDFTKLLLQIAIRPGNELHRFSQPVLLMVLKFAAESVDAWPLYQEKPVPRA